MMGQPRGISDADRLKYHVRACIEDIGARGGYWGDPDCVHEWQKPVPFQFSKCVKCGRWKWHHEYLVRRVGWLRRAGARLPEADSLVPYKPRRGAA